MSKPILLCDVDDVLVDLSGAWIRMLNEMTGREHTLAEVSTFRFEETIASEAEARWIWKRLSGGTGLVYDLPLYPGALDFLAAARERCRVVACTNPDSPQWGLERTEALIEKMGFDKRDIILVKDKSLIHGDFMVDDAAHNVQGWESGAILDERCGILWNRPWNASFQHHSRASTYAEVLAHLE